MTAPYQLTIFDMLYYRGDTESAGHTIGIPKVLTDAEVKATAGMLAEEANEGIELAQELRKRIISYGGISGSSYKSVPAWYKRKDGQVLDCLATELGYLDDEALWLEIQAAENILRRLPVVRGKRLQKFRALDFVGKAEALLLTLSEDDRNVPF